MSLLNKEIESIWDSLRAAKNTRINYLEDVTIKELRGITDLRIPLPFPVCVLAGANQAGKTTALFAMACAYAQDGKKTSVFRPTTLFPQFRPKEIQQNIADECDLKTEFSYTYTNNKAKYSMRWRKGKSWNRSYDGRVDGVQPIRDVYIRTLANLASPSEVRKYLQIQQNKFEVETVSSASLIFAQTVLGNKYEALKSITHNENNLLFVNRDIGEQKVKYSEFQMSSGERILIKLSMELSKLNDALVLIDEIDTGLHPHIQQLLMLELLRLSLRNNLQIIVTSHSTTIINSVPQDARLFLQRDGNNNVILKPPYKDILQKSLYGQADEQLSIICEDSTSESFLRGLIEAEAINFEIAQNDVSIGKDTGKDQFLNHLETFALFKKLSNVLFVLDGDGRDIKAKMLSRAEKFSQNANVLVLPGGTPESWFWEKISNKSSTYADVLGVSEVALTEHILKTDNLLKNSTDKESEKAKNKFYSLSQFLNLTVESLARKIGRHEATVKEDNQILELINDLKDNLFKWRSRK
jgi:AAA domain, putative AbiEii toxin, Type IV TA system